MLSRKNVHLQNALLTQYVAANIGQLIEKSEFSLGKRFRVQGVKFKCSRFKV